MSDRLEQIRQRWAESFGSTWNGHWVGKDMDHLLRRVNAAEAVIRESLGVIPITNEQRYLEARKNWQRIVEEP